MKRFPQIALLLLASLWVVSCGGPQEFVPSTEPRHNAGPYEGNACAYGAIGPDCDGDGQTDECEAALGTPACNPDCDGDGIRDDMDDPKDCLAPGDPKKDPDYTDPTQDANRDRILQLLSSGLLLGNASISGKAPAGTKIELLDQKFRVVSRGEASPSEKCGTQFILLTISGAVGYCVPSALDPSAPCNPTMSQARIKMCAPVTIPSNLTASYPKGSAPTSIQGSISNLNWTWGETEKGAFEMSALRYNKGATTTNLTFTVSSPSEVTTQCANGSTNAHLYNKLHTNWTTTYLEEFLGTIRVCSDPKDPSTCKDYKLDGGTVQFQKNWKRTGSTGQVCDAPGVLGDWVNSD